MIQFDFHIFKMGWFSHQQVDEFVAFDTKVNGLNGEWDTQAAAGISRFTRFEMIVCVLGILGEMIWNAIDKGWQEHC